MSITVNGRVFQYSGHAIDRSIERGIVEALVERALKNEPIFKDNSFHYSLSYSGKRYILVVSMSGDRIITLYQRLPVDDS